MPRIIVLALLFFVSGPSIVGAAPIRIAYKGRFVDLERRFEPNAPFYCDVHGEFVIDETLPDEQAVVSASMVIDDKEMSLLAPAGWRRSSIRNNIPEFSINDSGEIYVIRAYDEISFYARFAGLNGVMYEQHGTSGMETSNPGRDPDVLGIERDRGYGITLSLIGPSSWFDPITNPITRLRGLATFDQIEGVIDYREWKLSDEQTYSTFEVTSIEAVPEPAAMTLMSTSIVVGLSFLLRNARMRNVRL